MQFYIFFTDRKSFTFTMKIRVMFTLKIRKTNYGLKLKFLEE